MVKIKNALWFDIFQLRTILAPNIALKWKKLHPKIAENSSPHRGGGRFDLGFEKNSKLFLQITIGEMKKAPQAKIFVIGTIFAPKMQKMASRKFTLPRGGTENVILGIPRPGEGITQTPLLW